MFLFPTLFPHPTPLFFFPPVPQCVTSVYFAFPFSHDSLFGLMRLQMICAAWLADRPVWLPGWSELESSRAPVWPAISWGAHMFDVTAVVMHLPRPHCTFLLLLPSKPKELSDCFHPIYKVLMLHIPCQAWEGHKPGL